MAVCRNRICLVSSRKFHINPIKHQNNQTWSTPSSLVLYQQKSLDFLKTKTKDAISWYEEFTGLRELREAQYRVILATDLMKEAQDQRREAKVPLANVQRKLQDFQPELRNTPRDDDRYMLYIKEEHILLKEVKLLQQRLQDAENIEREAFERLSTALRTSHEAERVQAEKTKYWSIIASVIGTIIGVVGTSINNRRKMKELKELVKANDFQEIVSSLETKMLTKEDLESFFNNFYNAVKERARAQEVRERNYTAVTPQPQHSNDRETLSSEEKPGALFLGACVLLIYYLLFRG